MDEYGNEEKKGLSGTAIVLIVVGVIVGLVVIMGFLSAVVFLWAESFTSETTERVETLNIRGSIDATNNVLEIEVLSGTVEWGRYEVIADESYLATIEFTTSAGESAEFTGLMWDPEPGTMYELRIIEIDKNRVIWEDDILAKP